MSASYTHRLDPRTDANLTAAIHAVGSLLGVGSIADSIVEHLKDRIGDSLSPEQRINPFSVYSGDILGRMAEYVKETFGLDKPANMHAAPQGPQAKDVPIPSDSVFALDGLGRNRFEQLTGGTSGTYARMVADVSGSSAAYSVMTVWNPSSGAAGLNAFNFGGTPFAQNGLDLATTQYLSGQGFTTPQILNATADMKALGYNPKDKQFAEGFASQERLDPPGRGQRQSADQSWVDWTKQNKGQLNRLQAIVDATAPGSPEREAASADLNRLLQQGYVETGQAAVDERIATVTPAPDAKPDDRAKAAATQERKRQDTFKSQGVTVNLRNTLGGADAARDVASDVVANAYHTGNATRPSVQRGQIGEAATDDLFAAAPAEDTPSPQAPPSSRDAARTQASPPPAPTAQEQTASAETTAETPGPQKPAKPPLPLPGGLGHR